MTSLAKVAVGNPDYEEVAVEPVVYQQPGKNSNESGGRESADATKFKYSFDENPEGMTDNLKELAETGAQMLTRVLQDGEIVTAQFDCYFPGDMIPVWRLVLLCIVTCGLYAFVLLFRMIRRWFYRMRICTPDLISFERGKLAITNKGRLICWKEYVSQKKEVKGATCLSSCCTLFCCCFACCFALIKSCMWCMAPDLFAAPVEFSVVTKTRIYGASQIRQVSQFYRSKAAFLCWCTSYECGVEVCIDAFNFSSEDCSVTTSQYPKSGYYQSLGSLINSTVSSLEASFGGTQKNILNVFSNTLDRKHNGDIHTVLDDLCSLQREIIMELPTPKACFLKNDDIKMSKGGQNDMKRTDKFLSVVLVADDRRIEIPTHWLSLMAGEEIIASNGEVYRMGCWEWFLTCITLGYYYCRYIHHIKYDRSAQILTNLRIIDMDIYHRAGQVPDHLSNFSIKMRSFFCGKVEGGYICSKSTKELTASLNCSAGQLLMTFPSGRNALPFARCMQMACSRTDAEIVINSASLKKQTDSHLTAWDFELLPLMPGEKLLSSVEGDRVWLPFGSHPRLLEFINSYREHCDGYFHGLLNCDPVGNACSKESCYCFWPYFPYLVCCCLRPFQNNDDLLLTPTTLIRYTRAGNFGLCCMPNWCMTKDYFLVTWMPIDQLIGQNLDLKSKGRENCRRRLCRSNCIGRICCPIGTSTYSFEIDMRHVSFNIAGTEQNKNWNADPKLRDIADMISTLQIQIEAAARARSMRNHV